MKQKQFQELKTKPVADLRKSLGDEREKLRKLRFDLANGKVKNIREIKATKKTIAKIMTIIKAQ